MAHQKLCPVRTLAPWEYEPRARSPGPAQRSEFRSGKTVKSLTVGPEAGL